MPAPLKLGKYEAEALLKKDDLGIFWTILWISLVNFIIAPSLTIRKSFDPLKITELVSTPPNNTKNGLPHPKNR